MCTMTSGINHSRKNSVPSLSGQVSFSGQNLKIYQALKDSQIFWLNILDKYHRASTNESQEMRGSIIFSKFLKNYRASAL